MAKRVPLQLLLLSEQNQCKLKGEDADVPN